MSTSISAMSESPLTPVNAEGIVVKTVSVASSGEQIGAAGIGLLTAGPLGALASWGVIRMFAGKWTPWLLVGIITCIPLNFFQLAILAGIINSTVPEYVAPSND